MSTNSSIVEQSVDYISLLSQLIHIMNEEHVTYCVLYLVLTNYVGLDLMYEVTHCTGHIGRWDLHLESGIPCSLSSQTISHPPEE